MEKAELPSIGMSPGNSYFNDKHVTFLMREVIRRYGEAMASFPIFQPSLPTERSDTTRVKLAVKRSSREII